MPPNICFGCLLIDQPYELLHCNTDRGCGNAYHPNCIISTQILCTTVYFVCPRCVRNGVTINVDPTAKEAQDVKRIEDWSDGLSMSDSGTFGSLQISDTKDAAAVISPYGPPEQQLQWQKDAIKAAWAYWGDMDRQLGLNGGLVNTMVQPMGPTDTQSPSASALANARTPPQHSSLGQNTAKQPIAYRAAAKSSDVRAADNVTTTGPVEQSSNVKEGDLA